MEEINDIAAKARNDNEDEINNEQTKRENLIMIMIWTLYEYLSVRSGIILENKGLAMRELELGIEGRRERFGILMSDFEKFIGRIGLDNADMVSYELISSSYDEHGISEQFCEDTILAIITNTKVVRDLKKMGLQDIFLGRNCIQNSCRNQSF